MKILWAFDPFDKNRKLHQIGKNLLKMLVKKEDQLKVIYVAAPSEVNLVTAFNIPQEKKYTIYPKKIIKKELIQLGIKKLEVEVLPNLNISLTSSVTLLAQFAQKNKCDFILLATNGRQCLPRLIFGSFAETLVHLSCSDLLIYHQKTKFEQRPPKNILYAHDFSMKGSLGLLRALDYAKRWNASLSVVHITRPDFDQVGESYQKDITNQAKKMENSLKSQNIDVAIYLETSVEMPSIMILKIAKKTKADIIVVAAQSGNLTALLGGSVTRQILHESTLLTLVLKV